MKKKGKVKKASSKNKPNNLANYNSTRSSVKEYLKSTNQKYTAKQLNGYTKKIYGTISSKYKSGTKTFDEAIKNIDVFVGQFFVSETKGYSSAVDVFEWWLISSKVASLAGTDHVIVDVHEVISDALNYSGEAYMFDTVFTKINTGVNGVLRRKRYAFFIQAFFRSEAKQKEFHYYLLVEENDPRLAFSEKDMHDYFETNLIFDIEAVYDSLPVVTKERSAYLSLEDLKKKGYYGSKGQIFTPSSPIPVVEPITVQKPIEEPSQKGVLTSDSDKLIQIEREKQKTLSKVLKLTKQGFTKKEIFKLLGIK